MEPETQSRLQVHLSRMQTHHMKTLAVNEARQAVIDAARAYLQGGLQRPQPDWATGLAMLKSAVRALDELEAS